MSDAPFDRASFLQRVGDAIDAARDVSQAFTGDVTRRIDTLTRALDHGDLAGARHHAHAIKGAALDVSAAPLARAAAAIERAARAEDLAAARATLPSVVAAFDELVPALLAAWPD